MESQGVFFLNFVKVRENAIVPKKATEGSAGWDLHACLDREITLEHGDLVKVPCGIAIELPKGFAAFIFARSGLGIKHGIIPSNAVGVIDSDYRGEIQVGLCRIGKGEPYKISAGDRIAQMVVIKVSNFSLKECEILNQTERGTSGFGASGK
ncbi:MAG: dUTP diphosphatase [Oscillospiraceae bacterium]|jgi:dUTP pyrophosphatase|nr:dUTP diphosphatase [Oscillospiraceae bacterium]